MEEKRREREKEAVEHLQVKQIEGRGHGGHGGTRRGHGGARPSQARHNLATSPHHRGKIHGGATTPETLASTRTPRIHAGSRRDEGE
jgi:hypothetical protein